MNTFKLLFPNVMQAVVDSNAGGGAVGNPTTVVVPVVPPVAKTKEQIAAEKEAAAKEQADMIDKIKAAFNNTVDVKPTQFFFKKVEALDSENKPTGIFNKRPTITLPVIIPSYEGILEYMKKPDSKECALIQEAVAEVVYGRAREIINDDETLTAANFDLKMLQWDVISNLPAAERRGSGIAKETWEEFVKDYVAVMPSATGSAVDKIQKSAALFGSKYATVKTVKSVLKRLKELLGIYANATTRGEEFEGCIEFLSDKADKLLSMDETKMADAL